MKVEAAISPALDPIGAPASASVSAAPAGPRKVWGLDPASLHSRYWASRGIQVVPQGEPAELVKHAELYLLTDPRTMTIFRLIAVVEQISWLDADLMVLRLSDTRDRGYREITVTDDDDRLIRFRREYGGSDPRLARVALTPDREVARLWQQAATPREGWRRLRSAIRPKHRSTMSIKARVYDRQAPSEVASFVRDLVQTWRHPDSTIHNIERRGNQVWAAQEFDPPPQARFAGPVWIGAGRTLPPGATVVGPAVLWDDARARHEPEEIRWLDLEPTAPPAFARPRRAARSARVLKRAFDVVFAVIALALTIPLYPFIALAIILEDPGPIFFIHRRETLGGRVFGCIKFRSMKKHADKIKRQLQAQNRADGPQFYIPNDPRLTRVGSFLRICQLDEIPQFINVVLGHMSIVGPRPSPFEENQYCPPWREARLSVRPGVTGLWQVKRTRAAGSDFQEWIRYDIEYVERQSFWLDMVILWKTVLVVIRGVIRS